MSRVFETLGIVSIIFILVLLVSGSGLHAQSVIVPKNEEGGSDQKAASVQTVGNLELDGDVRTPLNLSYAELLSFPMVSEVAELKCVTGSPDVTYNWTGIPLFYLLTLAQIKPDAYKVVTICSDGYTSDILVSEALQPTTILALRANGNSLPQLTYGPAGPNRLAVPGKLGYKWSSGIEEIEVVTTDYKGEWESNGYSDQANVPNYGPMPTPVPAIQTLYLPLGNRTYEVGAFTNASQVTSNLNASMKTLNLNFTTSAGTSAFADLILQQDFLGRPFNVTIDGSPVNTNEADTNSTSYLYFDFNGGSHVVNIIGTALVNVPEAVVYYKTNDETEIKLSGLPATANIGQNVTFDASKSQDVGLITSYEWSFGDGTTRTGSVVSHSYSHGGTYEVQLNLTNNQGLNSLNTFTISVERPLNELLLVSKVFLVIMLVALVSMFAFLVKNRKTPHQQTKKDSPTQTFQEKNLQVQSNFK